MIRHCLLPLAMLLAAAFVVALAAPASKPLADPDYVTGPLQLRFDSPVVRINDDDDGIIWLVFRSPAEEVAGLKDLATGTRVTVRGKRAAGGRYSYMIVSKIARED